MGRRPATERGPVVIRHAVALVEVLLSLVLVPVLVAVQPIALLILGSDDSEGTRAPLPRKAPRTLDDPRVPSSDAPEAPRLRHWWSGLVVTSPSQDPFRACSGAGTPPDPADCVSPECPA